MTILNIIHTKLKNNNNINCGGSEEQRGLNQGKSLYKLAQGDVQDLKKPHARGWKQKQSIQYLTKTQEEKEEPWKEQATWQEVS